LPGTRYDEDLDHWIVRILRDSRQLELQHNQLESEVNLRHKVSSATLSSHLDKLYRREILYIRVDKNKHTYYSLTEEFKAVWEFERKANYLTNAFSRFDMYTRRSRKKVSWQLNMGRRRKSMIS
jgi:DNA-binding transcriptional ArsR family regulator